MDKMLCLAAGSLAGGFGRWLLSDFVDRSGLREFPLGTLLVNLSGCLLIGVLHGLGDAATLLSPRGRMLLMVGFCGAFTTFSTLMLEISVLLDKGQARTAFAYVLASGILGLTVLRVGAFASRMAFPAAQAVSATDR